MDKKSRIDTLLNTFSKRKNDKNNNNIPSNYNNNNSNNNLNGPNPNNYIRPNNNQNNNNIPNNYENNNYIRPNNNQNNNNVPNNNYIRPNHNNQNNNNVPNNNYIRPSHNNLNNANQSNSLQNPNPNINQGPINTPTNNFNNPINPNQQQNNINPMNQGPINTQTNNFIPHNHMNNNIALNTYQSDKEAKISNNKINSLMPKTIAYEIKSEKWRSLLFMIMGFATTFLFSIFLAGYYMSVEYATQHIRTLSGLKFWGMNSDKIPLPFVSIVFILIGLFLMIFGTINIVQIKREANHYVYNLNKGQEIIPNFIIENYKKMIKRSIFVNWFSFTSYILGGIVLGLLYAFKQYVGQAFSLGFWKLGEIKNLNTEIYITIGFLIAVFFMHLFNILLTKKRKSNIIGYYGKSIISPEEEASIRKKTNRLCLILLIVLLVLITILIILPWWLGKRKKEGKSFKFWRRG